MSTPTPPARGGRRLATTAALAAALAGGITVGVVLPATAAGAATPAAVPPSSAVPVPGAPATTVPSGAAPATPGPQEEEGRRFEDGLQPQGGVDTGFGGSQRPGGHDTEIALPVTAGGAGLGALAGLGIWRRRRAGARV